MTTQPTAESAAGAFVDLHLHSTASDGASRPAQVVAQAAAAGLQAIALTDHDTVAGLEEARQASARLGLHVVAGVELSAYQGKDEVHLLGLHLQHTELMDRELALFREARRERAIQMVARLNAIGVSITFDDVLSLARTPPDGSSAPALGRPHVAKALVENGWARDLRDAFDRYLGLGRPAYLDKRRLTIGEAIAMVHRAGGLAFLAHPGATATHTRLADLQAQGLDGVEVLHPSHSAEDRRRLLEAARALGMAVSGGSDSHGASDGSRVIGSMRVPASWLAEQLAYRGRRSADPAAPSTPA